MPDTKLKIEIAVQCHFFQRRLCWMLSSILQQDGPQPDITFGLAYVKGNGSPTTEAVMDFFRGQGIKFKEYPYDDTSVFQFRGLTRNRQLLETKADWLLYADADMVYPRNFFTELQTLLKLDEYKNETRCLHSERGSVRKGRACRRVEDPRWAYPCVIPDAFKQMYDLSWQRMKNLGAGYCQIVKVEPLRTRDGYYVNPRRPHDFSWVTQFQKARSDLYFRRRVGRLAIPLPLQVHCNHRRDLDTEDSVTGMFHHIEEQR